MSPSPIASIEAALSGTAPTASVTAPNTSAPSGFRNLIFDGLNAVDAKVATADGEVRQFLLDPTASPHHLMFTLEQARLSVELMVQVRNRLVEGYQEIMRLQL